jgi:DNA-binding MarR family transcriptional regulator
MTVTGSRTGVTVLVTRLARVIFRRTPGSLLGMPLMQFATLSSLRDRPQVSQQALCELMSVDANNLVLWLNDLESSGYVLRRRDPSDRRRHLVEITDAGLRALDRAERGIGSVEDDVLAALGPGDRRQLQRLLTEALEGVERD